MQKLIIGVAAAIILAVGGAMIWVTLNPAKTSLINAGNLSYGGPFELTAHTGKRMTSKEVIDRPALVYFGYTNCPDICPVDVQHMVDTVDILARRGVDVRPVFISVDPKRDKIRDLALWAANLSPKLIALTGTDEEVRKVTALYRSGFSLGKPNADGEYLVNHTTLIYIMTPQKGMVGLMRRGFLPEVMARDVRQALNR